MGGKFLDTYLEPGETERGTGLPVVVVGAGPAGLCAARELLAGGRRVVILESDAVHVGGISRTFVYKGNRFDIGGHRFFSKNQEILDLWKLILGDEMLTVPRLSRIHYKGKLFDYPLKAVNALVQLGPLECLRCLLSYVDSHCRPTLPEKSFDVWVSNRFGRRLFEIFFETYTEKVWGVPCREISADWAAQRIRRLNLGNAILNALGLGSRDSTTIKTLIDEFMYPRMGPGQIWERLCEMLEENPLCQVKMGHHVERIEWEPGKALALQANGVRFAADHFISSMPLRHLIESLSPGAPAEIREAAAALTYRDFLTVGLVVRNPKLFPDNWIYIHDSQVKVGRIQNYKNWSPFMVASPELTTLGLEYFCFEGDGLWTTPDAQLVELAIKEVNQLGMTRPGEVIDGVVVRMPKAYPVYSDGYQQNVQKIRDFLDAQLPNLQLVGRNGMHRYNNTDHSMLTGILSARNILKQGCWDLWKVNGDAEYLEEGKSCDSRMIPRSLDATPAGIAH